MQPVKGRYMLVGSDKQDKEVLNCHYQHQYTAREGFLTISFRHTCKAGAVKAVSRLDKGLGYGRSEPDRALMQQLVGSLSTQAKF